MKYRNVVGHILKLQSCARASRVVSASLGFGIGRDWMILNRSTLLILFVNVQVVLGVREILREGDRPERDVEDDQDDDVEDLATLVHCVGVLPHWIVVEFILEVVRLAAQAQAGAWAWDLGLHRNHLRGEEGKKMRNNFAIIDNQIKAN